VLHQIAGVEAWEGAASLVIAVLLGYVAVILGRDTKELLIGESADPVVRATAFATISSHPEITGVKEILTMQLGPASVLVAARVQFEDDLNAKRVQLVCTDIEAEMRERRSLRLAGPWHAPVPRGFKFRDTVKENLPGAAAQARRATCGTTDGGPASWRQSPRRTLPPVLVS